jgi:hypothetical protein
MFLGHKYIEQIREGHFLKQWSNREGRGKKERGERREEREREREREKLLSKFNICFMLECNFL